jgi:transposase-like protein
MEMLQRVLEGGRTIPQVARDLDLTESALRGWVDQARADGGTGKPGALTSSEREELTRTHLTTGASVRPRNSIGFGTGIDGRSHS